MVQSLSIKQPLLSGLTMRYASALFDLSKTEKSISRVETDLVDFHELMHNNKELMQLVCLPVFSSAKKQKVIDTILKNGNFSVLVSNFISVVVKNRRSFIMPQMLAAFRQILASHKGEIEIDVITARKLTDYQIKELQDFLKTVIKKTVIVNITVDCSILGGMIVKIGSHQIDTSIQTKLSSLRLELKKVD